MSVRPSSASRRPGSSASTARRKVAVSSSTSSPIGTTGINNNSPTLNQQQNKIKTLWDIIVENKKEINPTASVNEPVECNVLLLGGEGSGKTSLTCRILKRDYRKENPEKTIALEYTYGKKEEGLKTYIANIWELAGGRSLVKLIKEIITPENIHTFVAVIALDLTKPLKMFEDFIYFQFVLTKIAEDLFEQMKKKNSDVPDKLLVRAKKRFGEQHEDM